MPEKLAFASPAWIAAAGEILRDLVERHGAADVRFSLCEVFTGAPSDVAPNGTAAWHFAVDGFDVRTGPGELPGADVRISEDYARVVPIARLVYTPEIIAAMQQRGGSDPFASFPAYLVELHNHMARITA